MEEMKEDNHKFKESTFLYIIVVLMAITGIGFGAFMVYENISKKCEISKESK